VRQEKSVDILWTICLLFLPPLTESQADSIIKNMKTVTIGEIMLRLSPEGFKRFAQADRLETHYGGGEANVAVSLAQLGEDARFVTKLPAHDFGENAVRFLRGYGVDTSCILRGGERIGLYFLERGASQRGSRVIYDRKESAFALSDAEEYDFDCIFSGADWLHLTGITPALGRNSARLAECAMREAKRRNLTVSFDPNYRKNLWTEAEAKECFSKLLPFMDILITSSDGLDMFGLPPAGENADAALFSAKKLRETYGLRAVALTVRGQRSASENDFSAVFDDGKAHRAKTYHLQIVDRVGGGDAFAAGLIYALKRGMDGQDAVEFATAAGAFKHAVEGDVNLASAEEILALVRGGNGRVLR